MLPLALRLVFLLYCLGLSPDMGSIPSTIPPTDADSLAAVILSTFAELTPEVTSVPLELTAPSSIASAEQESLLIRPLMPTPLVGLFKPIHPRQESSNRLSLWLSPSS